VHAAGFVMDTDMVTSQDDASFTASPATDQEFFDDDDEVFANQTHPPMTGTATSWPPSLSQPPSVVAIYSIAYSVVLLLSLVNNTVVLVVIKQVPQLRTVTNYFLANLAVADLIVTFTVMPITLLSNLFSG
jgi:7 transmembrane receptor (rhodopsin family)